MDERAHEVAQIWQEDREPDRDRENELGEEILARLVGRFQERVELLEKRLEERQHLVVEDLESTTADRPEERAKKEIVRVRLGGLAGELERVHDQVRQVRQKNRLVLLGENGDGHERHLVQSEHDRRVLLVAVAEVG